jgi:hypothetical protein
MVHGVENSKFQIVGMGSIDVLLKINDTCHMSKLKNVLDVPKLGRNIFLIRRAIKASVTSSHTLNAC